MAAPGRGWWDKAVPVALQNAGRVTLVNNSTQAAEVLLYRWPNKAGPKHLAARRAVLAAMESHLDVQKLAKARRAFEAAAREAKIFTGD